MSDDRKREGGANVKTWSQMYANVHGSRRLLEGNILANAPFVEELGRLCKADSKVLEVGTGTGVLTWPLAQSGIKVVSIDNDREILNMAQINAKLLGADIEFQFADAFHLPFPDDSFDLAFSHGLIEHFPDDDIRALLNEQFRVAPLVVVGVPTDECRGGFKGDERLLSVEAWMTFLNVNPVANVVIYQDGWMLCVTLARWTA